MIAWLMASIVVFIAAYILVHLIFYGIVILDALCEIAAAIVRDLLRRVKVNRKRKASTKGYEGRF